MFNSNLNENIIFQSNTSNLELLMDACFPRQHKAHIDAWLNHQEKLTRAARNAAIDEHLANVLRRVEA